MKTDQLKINQQAYNWYLSYLKTIEAYDNFLADDCVMQFNKDSAIVAEWT